MFYPLAYKIHGIVSVQVNISQYYCRYIHNLRYVYIDLRVHVCMWEHIFFFLQMYKTAKKNNWRSWRKWKSTYWKRIVSILPIKEDSAVIPLSKHGSKWFCDWTVNTQSSAYYPFHSHPPKKQNILPQFLFY